MAEALLDIFSGSEEARGVSSYSGPQRAQPCLVPTPVLLADQQDSVGGHYARGLADINRIQLCIFPYRGVPPTQEIPQVFFQAHSIPVQGSAFFGIPWPPELSLWCSKRPWNRYYAPALSSALTSRPPDSVSFQSSGYAGHPGCHPPCPAWGSPSMWRGPPSCPPRRQSTWAFGWIRWGWWRASRIPGW